MLTNSISFYSIKIIIIIINIVELKRIQYSGSRELKRIHELLRRHRTHIMELKEISIDR